VSLSLAKLNTEKPLLMVKLSPLICRIASYLDFLFTPNNGTLMKNSRRQFMILSAAGACTIALNGKVQAQAMVAETDPQAAALGYKANATTVDKAKYAKYAAGQECDNCALFQGKAGAAAGGCSLFAGKQVAGKGWCSAYAKKA
jgi:hypothetical protein